MKIKIVFYFLLLTTFSSALCDEVTTKTDTTEQAVTQDMAAPELIIPDIVIPEVITPDPKKSIILNKAKAKINSHVHIHNEPLKKTNNPMPQSKTVTIQSPSLYQLIKSFAHYGTQHKIFIGTSAMISSYASAWALLLFNAYQITHKKTWATWRDDVPLEVLLSLPAENIAKELLNDAAEYYHTNETLQLYLQLDKDLESNIAQLHVFTQLHSWISYLKCSKIFITQKEVVAEAELGLKRLIFIQKALTDWLHAHVQHAELSTAKRKRYI